MSLITRCTHCGTSFRIAHAQLSARAGQVRCGRCSKVFDAYDRLTSTDGSTLPARPLPPEPAIARPVEPAPEPVTAPPAATQDEAPAEAPVRVPVVPVSNGPATLIDPFEDTKPSRQRKKSTLRYEQISRPDRSTARPRGRTIVMTLLALLLLALLAFQMLYYWRDTIVALYPQTRVAMQTFCEMAQCRIDFLKQPDQLSIEASSLEADPKDSSVVILRATLRNRAPFPQGFPALELTLTDIKDEAVARRVFMPSEYNARRPTTQGIEANAEVNVQIRMQLIGLKAQGYRLYLFYPRKA